MTGYRAITRARKIVFWISTTLFVLTWPLLILYALGIVISPSARHPVVETGVMRVESYPSGARVLLDGTDTGKTTPAAIERLRAGDYRIELEKSGYADWSARVSVDIQAVRRVAYAVLVPHLSKVRLVSTGSHSAALLSHNSQELILTGETVAQLKVLDLRSEHYLTDGPGLAPYKQDPVVRVDLLPWGGDLMLHILHQGRRVVLIVHIGPLGVELQHAVEEPPFHGADFAWSPTLSGAVYFMRRRDLWRMDSWSADSASPIAGMILSVGIVNNTLYYIDARGQLGEITPFGRPRVLFTIPPQARARLSAGTKIEYIGSDWGAVLAPSGGLYLLHAAGIEEYPAVRGVSVDKARERLIVWSKERVGSLPFPAGGRKGFRTSIEWAPGPPTNAAIGSVTPAASNSNCLFVSDGVVWMEPVIPGVVGQAQRILTLAPGEHYLYSEATGQLLVTDRAIGQMRVIRLFVRPLIPTLE